MSKQQHDVPETPSASFSFGKLLLWVGGAMLLLVALQKGGIKSIYKDESTHNVDFNSDEYQHRKPTAAASADDENQETDQTLSDIERAYGNRGSKTAAKVYQEPTNPLTEDEKIFFQKLKNAYATNPKLRNMDNWLAVMKSARKTYATVYGIFEIAKISTDETVAQTLNAPKQADAIFRELEREFDVPASESKDFPGKKVSDWALFIEQHLRAKG